MSDRARAGVAPGSDRLGTRASAQQTTDTIKIILRFTKWFT
jgi:hypothetical protein